MGNCLKSPTSDDISLLHESQSDRASFGDGTDPDLEPPPPYQVNGDGEQQLPVLIQANAFDSLSAHRIYLYMFSTHEYRRVLALCCCLFKSSASGPVQSIL